MDRNIAAYTPTEGYAYYPPYISINRDGADRVTITVRGPEPEPGSSGHDVTVTMPAEALYALARQIIESMDADLPDGIKSP